MSEIINISCPGCQTAFEVPDEMIGQTVECPQCNTTFDITAPESDHADAAEEINSICPGCNTVFEVPADMEGENVDCPQCGTNFTITAAPMPSPDQTSDDLVPTDEEGEGGGYTHTVKMSRTSIGMVPAVDDNFNLDVVGQHIQKTEACRNLESGEYAIKNRDVGNKSGDQTAPTAPPKKKWWERLLFWKK